MVAGTEAEDELPLSQTRFAEGTPLSAWNADVTKVDSRIPAFGLHWPGMGRSLSMSSPTPTVPLPVKVPSLAELAAKALQKQTFANLAPDDPLHGDTAFLGIATICIKLKDSVYRFDAPMPGNTDAEGMKKTLSAWEKARAGFGLKDKSAPIYVIYVKGTEVYLRIGFPRMAHLLGEATPLGGHIDLAGKDPVLAGGQVLFTKPDEAFRVKEIDNKSGHYQPNELKLDGEMLKSPKMITSFVYRKALGVEIDNVYVDPMEAQKKVQALKEEKELKNADKLLDLSKATGAEEKLLAFFKKVNQDGGLATIQKRNINPYVQTLANAVGRAKYGNQATAHSTEVQAIVKDALSNKGSLKEVVLAVLRLLGPIKEIRPEWVEQNAI
jgi:hypothetical protein